MSGRRGLPLLVAAREPADVHGEPRRRHRPRRRPLALGGARPGGVRVEWDAEIINEIQNKVLAWQSLPGGDVVSAGSVTFEPARGDRSGTQLTVTLQYEPPAGTFGALVASAFGREPSQTIREDLRRLKQLLEAGEIAKAAGAAGTSAGAGDEGGVLLRQGGHPRRAGAGPADPQPARRDRQGHGHRDLRLRPAPLRRLHPDHGARRHPRPRVHGRGRRGRPRQRSPQGRRPRRRAVHDRLRPLLLLPQAALVAVRQLEPQRRAGREAGRLLGRRPLRLLAHLRRLSGRPGRVRARAVRRRRADQGARRAAGRAGALPLRHLPDRLHGGRELRHPARRHGRGLGLRPGRAVRHQERLAARRRARHRHRPLPGAAGHGRGAGQGRGRSTTRRSTCPRRCGR